MSDDDRHTNSHTNTTTNTTTNANPHANTPTDLLAGLNAEQLRAVTHFRGPLLLLAGAGSGKTRVITRRIAWLIQQGVPPNQILGVTFTNKAAREMRERVVALTKTRGVVLSTFHSFCARFLREEHEALGLSKRFSIYDADDQRAVIKKALKASGLDAMYYRPADIQRKISNAKNAGQTPQDYLEANRGYVEQGTARIFSEYQDFLRLSDALDFDDLLLETWRILRDHRDIRQKYQERFRFVLIDEYQDTNFLQDEIGRLIAESHRNICVTGDPDQSIYSWRGAKVDNILGFASAYSDAAVVTLNQNYRSTPTILAAANAVIANNTARMPKEMVTENANTGRVVVREHTDEEDEATWVVHSIASLVSGISVADDDEALFADRLTYDDCAVFFRTNAQSRAIEQALRQAGIPYEMVRGVEFYQREEIKDLLAYLRVLHNPRDEMALLRIINRPTRGIGGATLKKLAQLAARRQVMLWDVLVGDGPQAAGLAAKAQKSVAQFVRQIQQLQTLDTAMVAPFLETLIEALDYRKFVEEADPLRAEDRIENIAELITDAQKYDSAGDKPDHEESGLAGYLEQVALIADQDRLGSADAETPHRVPLLTLHAAKGLEFPIVFLTGMEEGTFPHSRVLIGEGDIEEERRLAYVGMTRAMRRLYITHARCRMMGGTTNWCTPSRFVEEIPRDLLDRPEKKKHPQLPPSRLRRQSARAADYYDGDGNYIGRAEGVSVDYTDADSVAHAYGLDPSSDGGGWGDDTPPASGKSRLGIPEGIRTIELDDPSALSPGDRVFHGKFGLGRFVGFSGKSLGAKAEIVFDAHGKKSVRLNADLRRVIE